MNAATVEFVMISIVFKMLLALFIAETNVFTKMLAL